MTDPSIVLLMPCVRWRCPPRSAQSRDAAADASPTCACCRSRCSSSELAVNALAEQTKATNTPHRRAGRSRAQELRGRAAARAASCRRRVDALGQKRRDQQRAGHAARRRSCRRMRDGLSMLQQLDHAGRVAAAADGGGRPDRIDGRGRRGGRRHRPADRRRLAARRFRPRPRRTATRRWATTPSGSAISRSRRSRTSSRSFRTSPDAADAQFFIGESYYQSGKYAARRSRPTTAVDQHLRPVGRVPDALLQAGDVLRAARTSDADAIRVYQLIVKQYPTAAARRSRRTQALKRLGVIK